MRRSNLGSLLNIVYLKDEKDSLFDYKITIFLNSSKGYVHFSNRCSRLNKKHVKSIVNLKKLVKTTVCSNCVFDLALQQKNVYEVLELVEECETKAYKNASRRDYKNCDFIDNYLWLIEKNIMVQKLTSSNLLKKYAADKIRNWAEHEKEIKEYYAKKFSTKIKEMALYNIINQEIKNNSEIKVREDRKFNILHDQQSNNRVVQRLFELYKINGRGNCKATVQLLEQEFPLTRIEDLAGNLPIRKHKEENLDKYLHRYYQKVLSQGYKETIKEFGNLAKTWEGRDNMAIVVTNNYSMTGAKNYGALLRMLISPLKESKGSSLYYVPEYLGHSLISHEKNMNRKIVIVNYTKEELTGKADSILALYQSESTDTYGDLGNVIVAVDNLFNDM